jgi:hypothetical protein
MKKIGILTFHRGPNYGGFLQAWHLREAVSSLGHHADIINYQNSRHSRYENPILSARWTPKGIRGAFRRMQKARPFRSSVADLSERSFTTNPHFVDWKSYDKIVIGSDVVWDFTSPQYGADPCFFGTHPSQRDLNLIAYAVSCGPADMNGIPAYVREGIQRFSAIGVRDEKTLQLVQTCRGKDPQLVADPTWLQDDPRVEWRDAPSKPYVLVYGSALTTVEDDIAIHKWAKKNGFDIVSAASPAPSADRRYQVLTPFQWVELFRNASAVVTATLHGLLYATKYHKPFIMKLLPQTRDKAATTLSMLNCMNRVYTRGTSVGDLDLDNLMTSPSVVVSSASREFVAQSKNFLTDSISR